MTDPAPTAPTAPTTHTPTTAHTLTSGPTVGPTLVLEHAATLNAAMQHNAVPLLQRLRVEAGTEAVEPCALTVSLEPALSLEPFRASIPALAAGSTYTLESPALQLDAAELANVDERRNAQLVARALRGETVVAETKRDIELLAYAEWNGSTALPQLLAAFVQPNHPVVVEAMVVLRERLEALSGDPTLDGYQSGDTRRPLAVLEAVYETLTALELSYVEAPASFERGGQKVRPPEQLLAQRMGNCLDLSLFAAALLEHAGLGALVLLREGHAFVGAWLIDDRMPEGVCSVASRLRKLVEIGELAVIDITGAVSRPVVPRAEAAARALAQLGEAEAERFTYAVDVRQARHERILPLPARLAEKTFSVAAEAPSARATQAQQLLARAEKRRVRLVAEAAKAAAASSSDTPSAPSSSAAGGAAAAAAVDPQAATAAARIGKWKERLLDLSLRNRLLNSRETRGTLPLVCVDLFGLEDALASGTSFTLLADPALPRRGDPRDAATLTERDAEHDARLLREQGYGRLYVRLKEAELEKRLKELSRTARVSLEEGGANILYLAIGFLRWFETQTSEVERRAPLVLLPVRLTRRSARHAFALSTFDDEAQLNVTLLEKLKKDFGIEIPALATPPTDADQEGKNGLDVPAILEAFRVAVARIDRWEIQQDVVLGLFSFTKFLMWHDLEARADTLLAHPVVRHLALGGREPFVEQGAFPAAEELDDTLDPAETFCPLDADASQLVAIRAATQGKTFVLEGPPGTGKSQTITNLIAQCLAEKRTVLFVSEKMAALEVVKKRLEKVGLGDFCLELHSNKASKKHVLEQLGRTLARAATAEPEAWQRKADELAAARNTLNGYVRELHRPRPLGQSYFDVVARLAALAELPEIALALGRDSAALDAPRHAALKEQLARLRAAAEPCGALHEHPLRAVNLDRYDPETRSRLAAALDTLEASRRDLARQTELAGKILALEGAPPSGDELEGWRELAELLLASPGPKPALLTEGDWPLQQQDIDLWVAAGERCAKRRALLRERYALPKLLALELPPLAERFTRWARAFLFAFFMLFFARRTIRRVATRGLAPNRQIARDLETAQALCEEQAELEQTEPAAREHVGVFWPGAEADDWSGLGKAAAWIGRYRQVLSRYLALPALAGQGAEALAEQKRRLVELAQADGPLAAGSSTVAAGDTPARRELSAFVEAHRRYVAAREVVTELLALRDPQAFAEASTLDHLGAVGDRIAAWRGALDGLRDWTFYIKARDAAVAAGLEPLSRAHAEGKLATADLEAAGERAIGSWWATRLASEVPALGTFHAAEQERVLETFRETDRELSQLARELLRARLAAQVPTATATAPASSDLGILLRELKKKRAHLPIRRLFASIPNLLARLCPCMLMSPLSVAQYFDPRQGPAAGSGAFDLIVFDEASQIPVHDAIGVLARGQQAVVVGDSKQLPPTSFFSRVESDEDLPDEDDIHELESILDECVASQLPSLRLRWHYRSRHEHLIAFSNAHYYSGELSTFPGALASHPDLGVQWVEVPEGVYERGGARHNRGEAERLVAEVERLLGDPEQRERSIGVVTFSQAQQRLIEDLLDELRRRRPELEPFFGAEVAEPLFVKNLENVQGDERDVMLFSVGYGPDASGRIALGFGPLNREGGERRLNVAITRARERLAVFSTLRAEQIDLSRTRATGARHLKSFLEYAQRGPRVIAEAIALADTMRGSALEQTVAQALVARGHTLNAQVGCSGYRIDLGVVDPERPGRYLLGIEGDGAHYRAAQTARDRDRLRQEVLEGLGWRLHRVWSTDFWQAPTRELEKIETAIYAVQALDARAARGVGIAAPNFALNHTNALPVGWQPSSEEATAADAAPDLAAVAEAVERVAAASDAAGAARQLGTPYVHRRAPTLGSTDDFHAPSHNARLVQEFLRIVEVEAPIHDKLLARRLAAACGIERITQRVQGRVEALAELLGERVQRDAEGFFWTATQRVDDYEGLRVPVAGDASTEREAEQLPLLELANAAHAVLRETIALDRTDLARETARVFGISRLGTRVAARVELALALLVRSGRATSEGDRISLGREGRGGDD